MYRRRAGRLEVFLVHPGGPYWRNKDLWAWSIPKGEYSPEEDPLDAARREFAEETGFGAEGNFVALSPITQAGGKVVHAWALEGDFDLTRAKGLGDFRALVDIEDAAAVGGRRYPACPLCGRPSLGTSIHLSPVRFRPCARFGSVAPDESAEGRVCARVQSVRR